ncbi:hypothetical protein QN277_015918 [Acacia crassicarpa]|uniref:Uncharacterized protein n=1 Tax=Acacia crassicarpa TaxID=499986 RepID=A0AAE1KML3_9FABA|nr:hypothetical protein QN277_015918 [Acacia crassicarpa]
MEARIFVLQIASPSVTTDALQLHTRSLACSSVRNAALNACVFLLVRTATSNPALATTTGRPRKEDPNAPEEIRVYDLLYALIISNVKRFSRIIMLLIFFCSDFNC